MALEPLEQRQVLTAGLEFAAVPFTVDPTTQNLTVHYELSTAASAAFDVALYALDGPPLSATELLTISISNPSDWTVGSHDVVMSGSYLTEPDNHFYLVPVLDSAGDPIGEVFSGVFLDSDGNVQIFGTEDPDSVSVGEAAGSQIRVTMNAVDYFFDDVDVNGIHARLGAGDDSFTFDDDFDLPVWAFGGTGNDELHATLGGAIIGGGDGTDLMYVKGEATIDGGAGDDDTAYLVGGDGVDVATAYLGEILLNSEVVTVTNSEALAAILGDDNDIAVFDESDLLAQGFTGMGVSGDAGDDTIWFANSDPTPTVGMSMVVGFGGEGADQIVLDAPFVTRDSGSTVYLTGDEGDDLIRLVAGADAFDTNWVDGGADNDTFNLQLGVADVTVTENEILSTGNPALNYANFENLELEAAEGTQTDFTVVTTDGPLPITRVNGDDDDTLTLASEAGGSIEVLHASGTTSFDVDGAGLNISTDSILHIDLTAKNVSFDGISLDQRYAVTTDYIDPISSLSVHAGLISFGLDAGEVENPTGLSAVNEVVLLDNISNAMLKGRFSGHDDHISIGGTAHDLQYVNDLVLAGHIYTAAIQVTTAAVYAHGDTIPRFIYGWMTNENGSDVNRTLETGAWSDPDIWSLGHVPTDGELVQIAAGHTVTYDVSNSTDEIRAIEVLGNLEFVNNANTHLVVGTLQVLPGGLLEIGTEAAPIGSDFTATLEFADEHPDIGGIDPKQFGTGLLVHGDVTIHGSPVGTLGDSAGESQTWLRLAEEVLADDTQIVLSAPAPTGWNVGDMIVLPDTRQASFAWEPLERHSESVTIAGFNFDRTIIYLEAHYDPYTGEKVQYDHKGAYSYDWNDMTEEWDATLELLPHVALISRNVVLTSEDPDGYRGHALFSGRADVDIRYAQFQSMGRTNAFIDLNDPWTVPNTDGTPGELTVPNQIGRYSAHFHHLTGPINVSNTGYQYKFVGNGLADAGKWSVAVHDTHFGLIADNVVYKATGSAFITEDGSETGNLFLNNITIATYGTYLDDTEGLDQSGDQTQNDHARGGVGFWFRRTGNDMIGNVSADNTYGGLVITSYYLFGNVRVPNFRGASTHSTGQYTNTLVNEPGTISDNEIYGMGQRGVWLAHMSGSINSNWSVDPDWALTFNNLTMWHASLHADITLYHVQNLTFDNLLILGDIYSHTRGDVGTKAIVSTLYENLNMQILNSRIEGQFYGLLSTPASGTPFGGELVGTRIENSVFQNLINVRVHTPSIRSGNGNVLDLVDSYFTMIEDLPNDVNAGLGFATPRNIDMSFYGVSGSMARELTEFSLVRVYGYNGDPDDNFQVYYKEQAADALMLNSDWDWHIRGDRQIGAPTGSYLTNQEAWDLYGFATGGFIAPSTATESRADISGLVGLTDEFIDPTTWDQKVVLVTPWEGASFVRQLANGPYLPLRYIVHGLLPEDGGIKVELYNGMTLVDDWAATTPANTVPDGILWSIPVGTYTVRVFMVDDNGDEVAGTAAEAEFTILPSTPQNVILAPYPVDVPLAETNSQYIEIADLLSAAGSDYLSGKGVAVTGASGVQGDWQYYNGSTWVNVSSVSNSSAITLPANARLRFKVSNSYTYSALDADPVLTFKIWDTPGSIATGVDTTSNPDFHTILTLTQPLLAP